MSAWAVSIAVLPPPTIHTGASLARISPQAHIAGVRRNRFDTGTGEFERVVGRHAEAVGFDKAFGLDHHLLAVRAIGR